VTASQMSCTALPKAVSSVPGRTLVCGRLPASGDATGRADGLAGAPSGDPLWLGDVAWVALTGLVDAVAGEVVPVPSMAACWRAEQPASTASAAARATPRATARRRAPRTPMSWPVTTDHGTRRGALRCGDGEVKTKLRRAVAALIAAGGRRAPRSPRAAAAGTRAAAARGQQSW